MLQLLTYHLNVLNYFKAHTKTWDFFAAAKTREEQLNEYKTELLKNTYKFDETNDPLLFKLLNKAKEKLGLEQLPVQIYQEQHTDEINASIIFFHNEAHIVFSGPIRNIMDEQELLAILAHELTHIKLYTMINGQAEVADRIITSIANNYNSEPSYYETARLFRLYTEIFCDRGAYTVVEDTAAVITSLVKAATGLQQVNAESFVKQADEIFALENNTKSNTYSHPENFIRARSIQLWHEKKEGANEEISRMIEGLTDLNHMDIFKQKEMTALTKEILHLFLKPKWFQSTLIISQAKQFFPDFSFKTESILTKEFSEKIAQSHKSIQEYFSYLLLDFGLLDPGLEDVAFGWAFQFAEDIGLKEVFDGIVKKELKFSDKKLQQHKQKTLSAFHGVKEGEGEQIYEG
jgi:hypothetical protein